MYNIKYIRAAIYICIKNISEQQFAQQIKNETQFILTRI